ncbi:major facilitator superfamily transporter [Xylariaceae sp. FL0804]|nr:major facilitator superfamily transporter [Xylariaceae sp. FL0804]
MYRYYATPSKLSYPTHVVSDGTLKEHDAGSDHAVKLLGDETYPEGGSEAWLVVLGSFCGMTGSFGLLNTIATFQDYVSNHQLSSYSEGTIGWIFSVYVSLCFLGGVSIGPLFDKYGPRWLLGTGTVAVVISLMLMSICTEYWHFMLCFGVLNGLGSSLIFIPCITAVGHFFRRRRGLASGIASTGSGLGGVIFPLMLQKLFVRVGWAWALRSLGFLCLGLLLVANVLVKKRLPPARNASARPDFRILRQPAFLLLTVGVWLLEFGLFIPVTYISSYALANGFGPTLAFQILPILNGASVLGRALPGWLADHVGPFNSNIAAICVTVVACFAVWLPFGASLPGLVVFAIMFGFATGNNISITPVCVGQLCRTQEYGRYYATTYSLVSVGCLVGVPVAGTLVTAAGGRYWALIVFTGLTQVLSAAAVDAAKGIKVGWKPWAVF